MKDRVKLLNRFIVATFVVMTAAMVYVIYDALPATDQTRRNIADNICIEKHKGIGTVVHIGYGRSYFSCYNKEGSIIAKIDYNYVDVLTRSK